MKKITFILALCLVSLIANATLMNDWNTFFASSATGSGVLEKGTSALNTWNVAGNNNGGTNATISSNTLSYIDPNSIAYVDNTASSSKIILANTSALQRNSIFYLNSSGIATGVTYYASFLLNISAAPTSEGAIFCFSNSVTGNSMFGRVYIKQASGNAGFLLGASAYNGGSVYTGCSTLNYNSTHLIIVRYYYGASSQAVDLFIDPTFSATEPSSPTVTGSTNASVVAVKGITIVQPINVSGAVASLRLGTAWTDVSKVPPPSTTTTANVTSKTGATFNGNISADGGLSVTDRGFCYKASSGVTITDNKTSEGGTSTGTFSKSFTGFNINTQYFYKAYATNSVGTTLSTNETSFYTLADLPIAPTLGNATSSSIDVSVNLSTNPSNTQFAIHESVLGKYVQADGTLGASAVWQTATSWGIKTVSGLAPSTAYTFEVKARNGDNTETAFGSTAGASTTASSSPVLSIDGISAAFGSQCIGSTTGPNYFTITGASLTGDPVTVAALSGFSYCLTSGGTYASSLSITQSGGAFSQIVYVKFSPSTTQSYNGNIAIGGGGATSVNCAVTGTGINTLPTVTTTTPATSITNSTVTLSGNVSDAGCQTITARGICYGTTASPDLTGSYSTATGTTGDFSSNISSLSGATTYHFRAYATSSAGTSYGADASFTTLANAPTAQVSNISFSNITSTSLTVAFDAAVGGADNYLVLRGTSAPTGTPVNGTSYAKGNTNIGSGTNTVAYVGPLTTFNETGLTAFTTYYYTIYSYNGTGVTANYFTTSPATANQLTARRQITSTGTGTWASLGATQNDDVTIAANHVITISASGAKCNNLTINPNGKVWATTAQTLQVYGTSLVCDGTFGDALVANSLLTLQFGGNLTITGSGLIYPYKVQPVTGLSNIGVTFSANTEVTYQSTAIISDNTGNDNITYTVTNGKKLTVDGNWPMASSTTTNGTANTTININAGGEIKLLKAFSTPMASGKTCRVNIAGTLTGGTSCSLYSYSGGTAPNDAGGSVIFNVDGTFTTSNLNVSPITAGIIAPTINLNSTGNITVSGTADFSNTSVAGNIGGAGTFTLASGGTINIAATAGLDPTNGPIRTDTRSFNSGANYAFVGTSAQSTGSDLPSSVNSLTINNVAGVTLSANTTVTGALTLTSGLLHPSSFTLTSGSSGTFSGASASSYVNGSLSKIFAATGTKILPIGKGGNYRPVTISVTTLPATSTFSVDQTESAWSGTLPAHTTSSLARNWSVSQSGSATYSLTLSDVGFTPTGSAVILQNNSGTINSRSTTGTYTAAGITGVGNFGLGDFVATIPDVPTIGTATAGDTQATVAFTAPADNGGSAILDYTVTPYDGATAGTTVTGSASPITVTGLTNGTAYTFKVTARNSLGSSSQSSASNSVTPIKGLDTPTVGVASDITTTGFTANWSTVANASSYDVEVYLGGSWVKTSNADGPTANNLQITGLSNFRAYTFKVRAKGNGSFSDSNLSSPSSVVVTLDPNAVSTINPNFNDNSWGTVIPTPVANLPASFPSFSANGFDMVNAIAYGSTPTDLRGVSHTNVMRLKSSVNATMTFPTLNSLKQIEIHASGGGSTKSFIIEEYDVVNQAWLATPIATLIESSIDTIYIVNVDRSVPTKFRIKNNSSSSINISQITTRTNAPVMLAPPTPGTASSVTNTTCTVNWSSVTHATNYEVRVYKGTTLKFTGTTTDASTSLAVTGLQADSTYTFKVKSIGDASYLDSYLSASSATFTMGHQLATPSVGTASQLSSGGFTANWTAVSNAVSYDINVYDGSATLVKTVNASSSGHAVTGLNPATAYTYTIVAVGDNSTYYNSFASASSTSFSTLASYAVSTTAGTGGSIVSGAGSFDAGTNATVVASVSSGYHFVNWTIGSASGTEASTSLSYTFTVSSNVSLYANFAADSQVVNSSTSASTMGVCTTCDVTVAGNGTTLTVDVPKTVNNITVGSGTKLNFTGNNKVDVTGDLTLKADNSGSFSANLQNGGFNVTGNVRYLRTILDTKWYFMSFPCKMKVGDITRTDLGPLNLGSNFFVKYYDGAHRAEFGTGNTVYNWIAITNPADSLDAYKGYIFGIATGLGSLELSFPIKKAIVAGETVVRYVPVAKNAGLLGTSHNGWNLIGQPYLSKYNGEGASGISYMTFSNGISTYSQVSSGSATIDPFTAYFVQVGSTMDVPFSTNARQSVRSMVAQPSSPIVQLNMTTPTGTDNTALILDDQQSTAYQIGQDLEKWIGTGTDKPQLYSVLGNVNYAFNALPLSSVNNLPLAFYTKTAGSTTIHLDASQAKELSGLLLTDNQTGVTVDLLQSDYSFTATAGTTTNRLVLNARKVVTDKPTIGDQTEPQVLIINSQILINNLTPNATVRVYDMVGHLIYNQQPTSNSIEFPVKVSGLYTVKIDNASSHLVNKVIVK